MIPKKLYLISMFFLIVSFNCHATVTLIDAPGSYPLGSSIYADPTTSNDTIITISSSNVILDINEYILTQTPMNSTPALNGVFIEPNLSNVTIRNGTITNISGIGVYVSDGCSEIFLEDLLINGCQGGGILLDGNPTGSGIFNGHILNCLVTSCSGTDGNPAYGVRLIGVRNEYVYNSNFNNNDASTTSTGFGLSIESCLNCEVRNCKSSSNGGNELVIGINIVNCNDCSLFNCESFDNISHALVTTATSYGFFVDSCSGVILSACKAINNSNVVGSAIGFQSMNSPSNLFEVCTAVNNIGGLLAVGFYFKSGDANSGLLSNTAAGNIASFINGTSYGILIDGPQGFQVDKNTLASNLGFQGYGLMDTTLTSDNLYTGNLSYNNTTTGFSVTPITGSFPVAFATVGDFSAIATISKYLNVAIVS